MNENILYPLAGKLKERYAQITETDNEHRKTEIIRKICTEEFEKLGEPVAGNLKMIMDEFLQTSDVVAGMQQLVSWIEKKEEAIQNSNKREAVDRFDTIYGTTTSPIVEQYELPEQVKLSRFANSYRYSPSPVTIVRSALDFLQNYELVYNQYAFVDVGSGMGRNLLIASEYPFKKITGIEISSHLTQIAKSNLTSYHAEIQNCKDIDLVCADVLKYPFINENMVLYFWEPFNAEISTPFIESLENFINGAGISIYLIFLGAVFPAVEKSKLFKRLDALQLIDSVDVSWPVTIYCTV